MIAATCLDDGLKQEELFFDFLMNLLKPPPISAIALKPRISLNENDLHH